MAFSLVFLYNAQVGNNFVFFFIFSTHVCNNPYILPCLGISSSKMALEIIFDLLLRVGTVTKYLLRSQMILTVYSFPYSGSGAIESINTTHYSHAGGSVIVNNTIFLIALEF